MNIGRWTVIKENTSWTDKEFIIIHIWCKWSDLWTWFNRGELYIFSPDLTTKHPGSFITFSHAIMVHNKVQEPLIACETKENSCKFGFLYNILKWVSIASHHSHPKRKCVCVCVCCSWDGDEKTRWNLEGRGRWYNI